MMQGEKEGMWNAWDSEMFGDDVKELRTNLLPRLRQWNSENIAITAAEGREKR